MSSIKKYRVNHNDYIVSFDIEIDLSKPACFDLSFYKDTRFGNSIKTDILAMSLFWSENPGEDACFEEHLKFFLEVLSRKLSYVILNETSIPEYIHKRLNNEEGYSGCFGDGIQISNVYYDDGFLVDGLSVQEMK